MDRDVMDTVYAVKVVVRVLIKFCPSLKNVFKGSLVRKIASLLPLRPAPRIHINIPLCSTPYESFYEDNYLPSMRREPSTTFFGSILSPQISSTPETQRLKIQYLERQLLELKQQVAKIILQIPTSDYDSHHSSVNTWLANHSSPIPNNLQVQPPRPPRMLIDSNQENEPPLPPLPPPPPPPPMPPQNFLTPKPKKLLFCTPCKKLGGNDNVDGKKSPASLLSDVIQQIVHERPILKPVKRSPGGNPLKTPKIALDDPSDMLSKVLRQRFSALHSESQTENCDNSLISSIHSQTFSCPSSPASAV